MVVDGALTLDEAYRETVAGLRNLGWNDLELDSKKRGIMLVLMEKMTFGNF